MKIKYNGVQILRNGEEIRKVRTVDLKRTFPDGARNIKIEDVYHFPSATLVDISYEYPQAYRNGKVHMKKMIRTEKIGKDAKNVRLVKG